MVEKKKVKKPQIKYFIDDIKDCRIPFSTIFEDEEYSIYELIKVLVPSKKSYGGSIKKYCKSNNAILNKDENLAKRFLWTYMSLLRSLHNGEYNKQNHMHFINDVINSLITKEFIDLVIDYVNSKKIIHSEVELKNNKYPEITTFTLDHYKVLHSVTALSKFIIPLGTSYLSHFNSSDIDSDFTIRLFSDFFRELFEIMKIVTKIDIYSKFKEYCKSSIVKSHFTNKFMWERIKIGGYTEATTLEKITNDLLVSLIPKFEFDKNIMNLVSVSGKYAIYVHIFRKKDYFNTISMNSSNVPENQNKDNNAMATDVEYMFSFHNHRDNDAMVLREDPIMAKTIERIMYSNNIQIPVKKINWFRKNIENHDLQTTLVIMMFGNYFSSSNYIYALNKTRFNDLICVLHTIFEKNHLYVLNSYLTGNKIRFDYKKFSKKLENILYNDIRYKKIMENNYKWVQGRLMNNNYIKDLITQMINKVYKYNEYDNKKINGEIIKVNEIEIVNEVLNFFKLL